MKLLLLIPLYLTASVAIAQATTTAPDPLKQILEKLNTIEQRLDTLESNKSPTPNTSTTKTPNNPKKQPSKATPAPQLNEMIDGMIVKIKIADSKKSDWFTNGISDENFAGFVTNEYKLETKQIQDNSLGYKGTYAIEVQGFFNAQETGRYTFGVLHVKTKYDLVCMAHISLNKNELSRNELRISNDNNLLLQGTVELEPGLYEYTVFSVCDDKDQNRQVIRTFLVKTPSDLNMRIFNAGEILHKK